ncbi:MAG: IS200/IS605 family transposase [bacterium]
MSTYTQLMYQIVFSTLHRENTLQSKEKRTKLYKYIWGVLEKKQCHLYRINGVEDHIHILTHIHPTISLSNFVKDIKLSTTDMIKTEGLFPGFSGWQDGYGAFTYSINEKDRLIEYIKNQEEHHKKFNFREEFIKMLNEQNIQFNEKYLM